VHDEHSFIPLLTVVSAAMVTGILLPRITILRIPLVVGEILVGIIVGKSGFGLIPEEPDPWLELMSLFGFTFLMFLSGLEIDFRSLAVGGETEEDAEGAGPEGNGTGLRTLLFVCGGMFVATLVTSTLLSFILVWMGFLESPWIMALIMSTTSVGLVMPLLKERGEGSTQFGQIVILSAVIADFVTMLLITVVVTFYETSGLTLNLLVVFSIFLLLGGVLWAGKVLLHRKESLVKRLAFAAPKTAELQVRTAMTLMLLFVVFSQFIGSEIILGAFLAGTAVSSLSPKSVHGLLGMKLDAIGFGFFIPIFFIMVGAKFDIQALFEDPSRLILVPVLVVFAFVVKVGPSLMLKRFFGRRNAIAAGFLLSSRLSLIIAASAIGLRLGVITPEINTAIILVAIVTCVVSPPLYGALRGSATSKKKTTIELDPLVGDRFEDHGLDLQLVEVQGKDFPFLAHQTLAEARLRQRTGLTLIGVYRQAGTFVDNPGGDFQVAPDDRLVLVGNEQQIDKLETMGERRSTVPPQVPPPPAAAEA
jgi:Kef-type K+ transport system membrane component KefB